MPEAVKTSVEDTTENATAFQPEALTWSSTETPIGSENPYSPGYLEG